MRRALLLSLVCAGCPYKVSLTGAPETLEVRLPDGEIVATPTVARLRWVPFGHQRIVAQAPGYRPLAVDLRRSEIRWSRFVLGTLGHPSVLLGEPRGEVRLVLVAEHGPVGTWTPEDLQR